MAVVIFGWVGSLMIETLGESMTVTLSSIGRLGMVALDTEQLTTIGISGLQALALTVAPVALATAVASVAVNTLQSGWVVATEALKVDWSRLNPVSGLKRLGFKEGGFNTVKMLLTVTILAWIGYGIVMEHLADTVRLGRLDYFQAVSSGWENVERLLRQASLALVIVALIDFGVQRWKFMESMKMSKQEVREDNKSTEGNPEIKGRIRKVQREIQRRRMMADVKQATVVITNPTEYAVAIQYERQTMSAPLVLAKGRGFLAMRIKAVAREAGVPIVENVPLAQALYRGAEVGGSIPADLFEAVAGVLAYLVRLKQLVL